MQATPKSNLID